MFTHALIPLDGSEASENALSYARELVKRMHLVRVAVARGTAGYPLDLTASQTAVDEETMACEQYLAEKARHLSAQGFEVSWTARHDSSPAVGILRELEEQPCDLVIMSSQGRTGFSRFMHGSVAHKVARHSAVPVLLVRHPLAPARLRAPNLTAQMA